jgi:hypothetical protein
MLKKHLNKKQKKIYGKTVVFLFNFFREINAIFQDPMEL